MDDLLSYGDESSLAALMEAAEDMTDDPRDFARGYVDGLPDFGR